jgi:hypothetical protein
MRTFIWTITALIAATLVLAPPSSCQSAPEKETQDALAAAKAGAQAAAGEAQQQAQEALKQADTAQKQAEDAALQAQEKVVALSIATNAPSPMPPSSAYQLDRLLSLEMSPHTSQSVLVIPIDEIKQEDLAAITEDIGIMCRVLEKKLQQEARIEPAKRTLFPFGADTGTEGIYLEGYGVLLLLNVDFPLIPPPETKKEGPPKEEGDTFWEETKSELHSTREDGGFAGGGDTMIYMMSGSDHPSEEYDPEKVEQLKTTLIKSLKHAANIHCLKPDESVVISVRGCAPAVVVRETVVEEINGRGPDRTSVSTSRRVPHQKVLSVKKDSAAPAVLTIRAKKSDIDAFSKGEISVDQFRQKVRIHTYQTSGRNMISEPSQR